MTVKSHGTIYMCADEVCNPGDPGQPGPNLVIDVAELVWEPLAG